MSTDAAAEPLSVRRAREADAAELARLSGQLGYPADAALMGERLVRIGARADHAVFVAARDVAPGLLGWIHVACGIHLESGESAEILGLVVDAAIRRGGVGRRLVEAAEQWSGAAGMARIVVRSNAARTEAHSFYPAMDYVLAKTQRVYVRSFAR